MIGPAMYLHASRFRDAARPGRVSAFVRPRASAAFSFLLADTGYPSLALFFATGLIP